MYKVKTTNKFEKDFAKCAKRNLDLDELGEVVEILERFGKLPRNYKAHILSGNFTMGIGSVTLNQIGCLSGDKTIK